MKIHNEKGITFPLGYKAAGISAGIKKKNGALDLVLLLSEIPASAAALYTNNQILAAPVVISKKITSNPKTLIKAVLANSGNANAATGEDGFKAAYAIQEHLAKLLNIKNNNILLASTGVIGKRFPETLITQSLPKLIEDLSVEGGDDFSGGILTTDTHIKRCAVSIKTKKGTVRIGGTVKGAGMIHPDMATMLAFFTTDVSCQSSVLSEMLKIAVSSSFNAINVDGETSTNDTVFLLANGASGITVKDVPQFQEVLSFITKKLALDIIKDAEGGTKCIQYNVRSARSIKEAREMARRLSRSLLVQTAFFGEDPNWGRILASLGETGVKFNPNLVDIRVCGYLLYSQGNPVFLRSKTGIIKKLKRADITVDINLNRGLASATAWGSDISYEYVKINAEYTTK